MKKKKPLELPSIEELEAEITRQKKKQNQHGLLRNALYTLIVVAAVTALVAVLFMPVLKTYGTSMSPTLQEGEIVVAVKTGEAKPGDVIAFKYNNRIFIKRVIASGGAVVDIDEAGNVSVDGTVLDEPYVSEKTLGNGDVEFPLTVPEGQYFVLGDNRVNSGDSRSSVFGTVEPEDMLLHADENLVGRVLNNLLKNAVEAIGEESDGCVEISAFLNEREDVVIEVTDSGGPIPPEVEKRIFIPFFTTKTDGSGIGLSISRQIMRLSGGTLTLRTKPHTTFTMTFGG